MYIYSSSMDLNVAMETLHGNVMYFANWFGQQGTHSTRTISEVSGTGRKPWNQKGTGRARHGSLRGPQVVEHSAHYLLVHLYHISSFLSVFSAVENNKFYEW